MGSACRVPGVTQGRRGPMLALALLAGCAQSDPCVAVGGHPSLVATMLFGVDAPGGGVATADQWAGFERDVVTPRFPDGFTVLDAHGQWRDPRTGQIGAEPSRVLLIAAPPTPATTLALEAVARDYKSRFGQRSVGILLDRSCAAF